MTDDKELAEKVVALGVGRNDGDPRTPYWSHEQAQDIQQMTAEFFVRDWRVAGVLMERCIEVDQVIVARDKNGGPFWCDLPTRCPFHTHYDDGSLPRAIIAACVEALS